MNKNGFVTFISAMYLLVFTLIISNIIMTISLKSYEPLLAKQIQITTKKNINHLECLKQKNNKCQQMKFVSSKSELKEILKKHQEMKLSKKEFENLLMELKKTKAKQSYKVIYDNEFATILKGKKIEYRFEIID